MDHNPVHGGMLFMADNNYHHHLEGTHPASDEFRRYFYDDSQKPLDPRNFSGRMVIETWNEEKEDCVLQEYPLELEKETNMWLTSRTPGPEEYPIQLVPRVWLAGEKKMR